jgi:hypothetical protein
MQTTIIVKREASAAFDHQNMRFFMKDKGHGIVGLKQIANMLLQVCVRGIYNNQFGTIG